MNPRRTPPAAALAATALSAAALSAAVAAPADPPAEDEPQTSSSESSYNESGPGWTRSGRSSSSSWSRSSGGAAANGILPGGCTPQLPRFEPPDFDAGRFGGPGFNSAFGGPGFGGPAFGGPGFGGFDAFGEFDRPASGATESSVSLRLRNTPLTSALSRAAALIEEDVTISPAAARTLRAAADRKVTLSLKDPEPAAMLSAVLKATGLTVSEVDGGLRIDRPEGNANDTDESAEGEVGDAAADLPLAAVTTDAVLNAPLWLTMYQAPAPMVRDTIAGQTGVRVELPARHRDAFGARPALVNVRTVGGPLRETLESVAKQLGGRLVVKDGRVSIELAD